MRVINTLLTYDDGTLSSIDVVSNIQKHSTSLYKQILGQSRGLTKAAIVATRVRQ